MKKIIGWALLVIGLIVISWGIFSSYQIFSGKTEAPEIFKASTEESLSLEGQDYGIEQTIQKMMGDRIEEMLPSDFLPGLFNLTAWSVFAFILFFGGAQISGLGIKLMR